MIQTIKNFTRKVKIVIFQAIFIDLFCFELLLKLIPLRFKKNAALMALGMSNQYFIYKESLSDSLNNSYMEILKKEYQRNEITRQKLCEHIIQPYLLPQMTVVDFGCGPGILAREVAKHCKKVLAIDISYGAIACAKILKNAENINYIRINRNDLNIIDDCSVDLIYSFAVFQHMNDEKFQEKLEQFYNILKPNGKIICHLALNESQYSHLEKDNSPFFNYLRNKFSLRMLYRSIENVTEMVVKAGFKESNVIPVRDLSNVEDDIVNDHIFVLSK